ncbi:MAG: hypothetical protein FJX47_03120, partial [Alphaproteobacteria bacterium]|nr:hypothetical protein [Alphaproteobacteria bacterium]
MKRLVLLVVLGLGVLLAGAPADEARAQDRRIALIIGVDNYKALPKLNNAVKDARDLDARLRGLGWQTILRTDVGRREMARAVSEFGGRIAGGAAGLVFYAGHGIEAGGQNFLVPIDAEIESEADLESEALRLSDVMARLDGARNPVNIVILDACRDNPLVQKGRSGERGLAVMPSTPTGLFVAYAAAPGQKAQDGAPGDNGIFTGELIKALEPGRKIEDVFKLVSQRVLERTSGRQVPWTQASLRGDFYFAPPAAAPAEATPGPGMGASPGRDAVVWQVIQGSSRPTDFETFMRDYPDSPFLPFARNRLDELKRSQTAALPPAAPAPQVALDPIDKEYVAAGAVRVREHPDVKSKQVAALRDGEKIIVLGKVRDQDWYYVERGGKPAGYVSGAGLETLSAHSDRSRREAEEQKARQEKEQEAKAAAEKAQQLAALEAQRQQAEANRQRQEEEQRNSAARRQQEEAERQAEAERRAAEEKRRRQMAMVIVRKPAGVNDPPGGWGSQNELPAGVVFRDCSENCPEMIAIRPGRYQMGAPAGERGATYAERPPQIVMIEKAFAIGVHEVTRDLYAAFVRETRYAGSGCGTVSFNVVVGLRFGYDEARRWDKVGFDQTGKHPVVCVSYQDARAYLAWLSIRTGRFYRLPSEAEWEFV